MDSIIGSVNPYSEKFKIAATQNVQQQMGTLKTAKEIKEDFREQPEDTLELSDRFRKEPSANENLEAASHAGVLSEMDGRVRKKEKKDKIDEAIVYGEYQEPASAKGMDTEKPEIGVVEEKAIDPAAILNRDISEINGGIPKELFEAAKKFVDAQIDPVKSKPAKTLTEMKSIPETSLHEMKPAERLPILDIHDRNNQPIPQLEEIEEAA